MSICVVFTPDGTQVGLVKNDNKVFDAPISSLDQLAAIPAIISAAKPQKEVKQGETLAFSVYPGIDSKLLPKVSQRLAQQDAMGKKLEEFLQVINDKPKSGIYHDAALIVLRRLVPKIRRILLDYKDNAKDKNFGELVAEAKLPPDVVNRIVTGSLNPKQTDLIRYFFPADAKKHLNFSLKEIAAEIPQLFKEVLNETSWAMLELTKAQWFQTAVSEIKLDAEKVQNFRLYMASPYNLKETFKQRSTKPLFSTEVAFRQLQAFNFAFIYPQWLITGLIKFSSRDLVCEVLQIAEDQIPGDIGALGDLCPESYPHVEWMRHADNRTKMLQSFCIPGDSKTWATQGYKLEVAPEQKFGPKDLPENGWKIQENPDVKIFKKARTPPSFQPGNSKLTEDANELIKRMLEKKMAKDLIISTKNFLSQITHKDLQQYAATVLYARMLTESIEPEQDIDVLLDNYEDENSPNWADAE